MDRYKILGQVAPKDVNAAVLLYSVPQTLATEYDNGSTVTTNPKVAAVVTQTVVSSIVVTNMVFGNSVYNIYLFDNSTDTTPDVAGGGTNGGLNNLVYNRTIGAWDTHTLDLGLVLPPDATIRCKSNKVAVEATPTGVNFTAMGIETRLQY
tara:strand:- start:218 stop:670 length:453 start_codon:yes stop_codon:yes gene_type:complete